MEHSDRIDKMVERYLYLKDLKVKPKGLYEQRLFHLEKIKGLCNKVEYPEYKQYYLVRIGWR